MNSAACTFWHAVATPCPRLLHDKQMTFAHQTTDALDALLVREGFAAGQCAGDQVIYCGGHDDLSDRFPRLPQADDQPRDNGCCIDLIVEEHDTGLRVRLEGHPLHTTLRDLNLNEAALSAEQIQTMPLAAALDTLAKVLPQLFRAAQP